MNDLISVVLPVYNGAQFLRESIKSVINQTYQNWELLILDDCSTDDTPLIAKEFQAQDARICYYRNEKNLKLPGNLNKGFSLSKGNYLTWTSDDNIFRPTAFEKMLTALQENPQVQLVYASFQLMDENGRYTQVTHAVPNGKDLILGSNVVGACFMYTRNVYETVGDYDTDLFLVEDWDFWQRVFMKFDAVTINEILYDYRQHSNSLTNTGRREEFGRVTEKMLLKNRPGFEKLSFVATQYFRIALFESRKKQRKTNPYWLQYCLGRISLKMARVFKK